MIDPITIGDCTLYHGDCADVLPTLAACSADAMLTDPPAGIGFMGKEWDDFRRGRNTADAGRENVFGRTSARGPEYGRRDRESFIAFLSSIAAECRRVLKPTAYGLAWAIPRTSHWTATALENAGFEIRDRISHLFGQGFPKAKSCLKPACEDWWLVRNPGDGVSPLPGLDACRIDFQSDADRASAVPQGKTTSQSGCLAGKVEHNGQRSEFTPNDNSRGRWPANVVMDEQAAAMLDEQSGTLTSGKNCVRRKVGHFGEHGGLGKAGDVQTTYGDTGGASRFFYCSKASRSDRGDGNKHPTVKPIDLMIWLATLITPPDGLVIDPFMGSGTTGVACIKRGYRFIGIERDDESFTTAVRRLERAHGEAALFT